MVSGSDGARVQHASINVPDPMGDQRRPICPTCLDQPVSLHLSIIAPRLDLMPGTPGLAGEPHPPLLYRTRRGSGPRVFESACVSAQCPGPAVGSATRFQVHSLHAERPNPYCYPEDKQHPRRSPPRCRALCLARSFGMQGSKRNRSLIRDLALHAKSLSCCLRCSYSLSLAVLFAAVLLSDYRTTSFFLIIILLSYIFTPATDRGRFPPPLHVLSTLPSVVEGLQLSFNLSHLRSIKIALFTFIPKSPKAFPPGVGQFSICLRFSRPFSSSP